MVVCKQKAAICNGDRICLVFHFSGNQTPSLWMDTRLYHTEDMKYHSPNSLQTNHNPPYLKSSHLLDTEKGLPTTLQRWWQKNPSEKNKKKREREREMRLVQLTMCVTVYITNGSEENQGWLSFHSDWSVWITRKFQNGKKLWVGNRQEINGSKIWVGRNSDSLLYGVNKKGRGRISILPFWVGAQLES